MLRSPITSDGTRVALALVGGNLLLADVSTASSETATDGLSAAASLISVKGTEITAIALSLSGGYVAATCEDKHVMVWDRKGEPQGANKTKKKPSAIAFACAQDGDRRKDVVLTADKFGDLYAMPLPDPSTASTLLLGHTATAITCLAVAEDESWVATGDRGEHVRISQFPKTALTMSYLMGHMEFLCSVSVVPGHPNLLLTAGGDKMVGLFRVNDGKRLGWCSIDGLVAEADDETEADREVDCDVASVSPPPVAPVDEPADDKAEEQEEVDRENEPLMFLKSMPLKIVGLPGGYAVLAVKGYAGLLLYKLAQVGTAGEFTLEYKGQTELPGEVFGMCSCGDAVCVSLASPLYISSYRVAGDEMVPVDEVDDGLGRACACVRSRAQELQLEVLPVLALDGRPAGELARGALQSGMPGGHEWNDRTKRKKRSKKG